ncbi:hypothetical protein BC830DRAFT_1118585 [Chytriomyces sp. MP71]|nr:hypothetical protein BC830DRAFT_1118585 [Chytriomyces sp. MP71]
MKGYIVILALSSFFLVNAQKVGLAPVADNATTVAASAASSAPTLVAGKNTTSTDSIATALAGVQTTLQTTFGNGTSCFVGCLNGNPKNTTFTIGSFQALCQISAMNQAQAMASPYFGCISTNCPTDLAPLIGLASNGAQLAQTLKLCSMIFPMSTNGTGANAGSATTSAASQSAASAGGAAASTTTAASTSKSDTIKLSVSVLSLVLASAVSLF